MRSSLQYSPIDSSFLKVNFTTKFQREHRERGRRMRERQEKYAIFSQQVAVSQTRCKIGPWLQYDGLKGRRICAFDWCQNYRPLMTLNGRYASVGAKMHLLELIAKI